MVPDGGELVSENVNVSLSASVAVAVKVRFVSSSTDLSPIGDSIGIVFGTT